MLFQSQAQGHCREPKPAEEQLHSQTCFIPTLRFLAVDTNTNKRRFSESVQCEQ